MSRASLMSAINWLKDEDIKEEVAEAVGAAYQFLDDDQTIEIYDILDQDYTSDRVKRAGVLAICNE